MSLVLDILIALFIFSVLIFIHELGHFVAAIKCGVKVLEFALGMGPIIWSKQTSLTKYSIRAIPMGGFCSMLGDEDPDNSQMEGSVYAISPLKRMLIMASGSIMNFISAFLIFMAIFSITGTDSSTYLAAATPGWPAYEAGMREGDKIIAINGAQISQWEEVTGSLAQNTPGDLYTIQVKKPTGETATYTITPALDESTGAYRFGIQSKVVFKFTSAVKNSFFAIGAYVAAVVGALKAVITGVMSVGEVFSGPIGVTAEIGRQVTNGMLPMLMIAAGLAVSLGFVNLLPLPALDGSRIVFAFIEWVKGSPVNKSWESRIHYVGFMLLIVFAIYIAFNDIANLVRGP
ncbi:MAG: M50 family metallopeptidase [Eubacteriaceae bacterium]|nr:M50 family metallopeptidase [Eubacteriaceae bacterium]